MGADLRDYHPEAQHWGQLHGIRSEQQALARGAD
jgi:hypothetical protein